jgi:D-arabinose 1-dehydrogenase-like Zn-dependent alcohol dehydrogenase
LLLLDLTGLSFCDARGLSAFVRIANRADAAGCRYGFIAPQPLVASIPVFDTVLNGTSVIGSIVGAWADLAEVFALHAAGRTRVSYETRPLAEVNEGIAEVLHGKARARLVLVP